MKIYNSYILYIFLLFVYALFSSCRPTRKLLKGELLLDKNFIVDKAGHLDEEEMKMNIKQKPNRKIIFSRFHLSLYNSVNKEKMEIAKFKRSARIDSINSKRLIKNKIINEKRKEKGKSLKKLVLKKKSALSIREWLLSIGEPPVKYDSSLTKKSTHQIKQYMNNKGFFNSTIRDSLHIHKKKAKVYYIINEGKPYTIRNLSYDIKDNQLAYYIFSDSAFSLIKKRMRYDVDVIQSERDRMTNTLRNQGFFYFSKEYIYFEIDSSLNTNEVNITVKIKNNFKKSNEIKDTLIETPHNRFSINNIYVHTDYNPESKASTQDTIRINNVYLLTNGRSKIKPRLITDAILFSKGSLFQQTHSDQTYKRLSELKMYRSVQIQYVDIGNTLLDCYIYLSRVPKQSFSVLTDGINTSGSLGVLGNIVYQNNNLLRGGEVFEIKLKGSLEVQKVKAKDDNLLFSETKSSVPFNTLELGSELNLLIPRFVTPFKITGTKSNNAKTKITSTYNFQKRPSYGRSIANLAFGYTWKETETKRHVINPIEFNLVNVFELSPQLLKTITDSKDLFLKNSYLDHFTLGSRYSFVFSNQDLRKQKNFSFLRIGAEATGNIMRTIYTYVDKHIKALPFSGESFTVHNIPFSQYLRFDIDYRYNKLLSITDKFVYRIAFGIGKPLYNLRVLPLEKSFFAGGPNGVRAWQARTLGPGAYVDSTGGYYTDKIGDVKVEGNLEYRFNIVKIVNGAMFIDGGNIWLRKPYKSYPGGEITDSNGKLIAPTKIVGQIALGTGMGIRLDFGFFIIRLDAAIKIKNPALKEGDRWMIGKKPLNDIVYNFGIGYPF